MPIERSTAVSETIGDAEHAVLGGQTREALGVGVGQQVRLSPADGRAAVFTVSSGDCDIEDVVVSPGGAGRLRGGSDEGPNRVTVTSEVVNPTCSVETAVAEGGFVERVVDRDSDSGGDLVACAPHGGHVEVGTDHQARRLGERLDASVWYCAGFSPGGGAYDRWHVTSTAVDERSFPGLGRLRGRDRGFDRAVAFHGWSREGVGVGGGAPAALRRAVADAVEEVLDEPVSLVEDGPYAGAHPENVVNRLSDAGVQLEQSMPVRTDRGGAVADAVANALPGD
jgi:phage replication-related protein YjqB (UPF0714/DUF867 family)